MNIYIYIYSRLFAYPLLVSYPLFSLLPSSQCIYIYIYIAAAKAITGGGDKSGPAPFRAGIHKSGIGLNPTKKLRHAAPVKQTNTALSKHKKWLSDMAKAKDAVRDFNIISHFSISIQLHHFTESFSKLTAFNSTQI